MYRNNHIYKVYSERPADLFHFYSGIVMVGTLFATHRTVGMVSERWSLFL